ncbi:MAG: 2-amino-4-oxopentanoate thiolase subunit OrtA [Bacillus subtilis]|nr:2-amino-4-oxopentanoate thiolase subunit OrtA [Bacillus subtilis]
MAPIITAIDRKSPHRFRETRPRRRRRYARDRRRSTTNRRIVMRHPATDRTGICRRPSPAITSKSQARLTVNLHDSTRNRRWHRHHRDLRQYDSPCHQRPSGIENDARFAGAARHHGRRPDNDRNGVIHMVAANTWVRIQSIVLTPSERLACFADGNTKYVPLVMWLKGELIASANIGDKVQVKTVTGRIVEGTLIEANPAFRHDFGADCSRNFARFGR